MLRAIRQGARRRGDRESDEADIVRVLDAGADDYPGQALRRGPDRGQGQGGAASNRG